MNILSMLQKNVKKIAIVMDEIDGMNSGDKGGINTLIKIIRPKKTKKQKLEEISSVPIMFRIIMIIISFCHHILYM